MEILIAFFLITQETKGEHDIGEEIIKGKAELRIDDQKIHLFPEFKALTPLDSMVSEERYLFDKTLYSIIDELNTPILNLHSEYLRTPVAGRFMYGSIALFIPKFEETVSAWELVITDANGATVRRFVDRGLPPTSISWDGRTDNGTMCNMGQVYNYVFTAFDVLGNPTRIIGRPYTFNGIVYDEKNTKVIAVSNQVLFSPDQPALLTEASGYFDEIANLIKENFKNEVVVYSYSADESIARLRGDKAMNEILSRTVLPQGSIKTAPRFIPGMNPKFSKIEIIIQ